MSSCCCGSTAVVLIAVLSGICYLATPYVEPTVGDKYYAGAHLTAEIVETAVNNVVNTLLGSGESSVNIENKITKEWRRTPHHPITNEEVYFKHKTPNDYDLLFAYAGCGTCVFIFFGAIMTNKALLLLGFLGKLAIDIAWPIMIINQKYETSCFGLYFIERLSSRETIPALWFIHIFVKVLSAIVILSYYSSISKKDGAKGRIYRYIP